MPSATQAGGGYCGYGSECGWAFGCNTNGTCQSGQSTCFITACIIGCYGGYLGNAELCADPNLNCDHVQFWVCNQYCGDCTSQNNKSNDQEARVIPATWERHSIKPTTLLVKMESYREGKVYRSADILRTWRKDGSYANRWVLTTAKRTSHTGRIVDKTAQTNNAYDDDLGTSMKMTLSTMEVQALTDKQEFCHNRLDEFGGKPINDDPWYRLTETEQTRPDGKKQTLQNRSRYNPDLGCTEVERHTNIKETGELLYSMKVVGERPGTMEELFLEKPTWKPVNRVGYMDAFRDTLGYEMICDDQLEAVRKKAAEMDMSTPWVE